MRTLSQSNDRRSWESELNSRYVETNSQLLKICSNRIKQLDSVKCTFELMVKRNTH